MPTESEVPKGHFTGRVSFSKGTRLAVDSPHWSGLGYRGSADTLSFQLDRASVGFVRCSWALPGVFTKHQCSPRLFPRSGDPPCSRGPHCRRSGASRDRRQTGTRRSRETYCIKVQFRGISFKLILYCSAKLVCCHCLAFFFSTRLHRHNKIWIIRASDQDCR